MSKTEQWEEFLKAECGGSGPHAMLAGNPPLAEVSVASPFDLPAWEQLPVYVAAAEVRP